jgi:hypothetical protein
MKKPEVKNLSVEVLLIYSASYFWAFPKPSMLPSMHCTACIELNTAIQSIFLEVQKLSLHSKVKWKFFYHQKFYFSYSITFSRLKRVR